MITLLLDSSSNRLSIGVARNNKVLAYIDEPVFQTQSEIMTLRMAELLQENNLTPQDINAIAVAYGPGSFTGVRIAVSISKVMAYALDIPLYAISSLAVFKHETKPTICVLNARNERSFAGVYMQNTTIIPDTILTNAEVIALVQNNNYVINGETSHLGVQSDAYDRFSNMLSLMIKENEVEDIAAFKPVYLKG